MPVQGVDSGESRWAAVPPQVDSSVSLEEVNRNTEKSVKDTA